MDQVRFLHRQAEECRRAADDLPEGSARQGLLQLARHYDAEARRLNLGAAIPAQAAASASS